VNAAAAQLRGRDLRQLGWPQGPATGLLLRLSESAEWTHLNLGADELRDIAARPEGWCTHPYLDQVVYLLMHQRREERRAQGQAQRRDARAAHAAPARVQGALETRQIMPGLGAASTRLCADELLGWEERRSRLWQHWISARSPALPQPGHALLPALKNFGSERPRNALEPAARKYARRLQLEIRGEQLLWHLELPGGWPQVPSTEDFGRHLLLSVQSSIRVRMLPNTDQSPRT